jgi:integrase
MRHDRKVSGHWQVKLDKNGSTRSFWAFWEVDGKKGGRKLGPAHVKSSGRRTPRGAVIWRAADGPRPTEAHLTPKDANELLAEILHELRVAVAAAHAREKTHTLRQAFEGMTNERRIVRGLKRSTLAGHEDMTNRICRDLGPDTPLADLADGSLAEYFQELIAYKQVGDKTAEEAKARGEHLKLITIEVWTAQPAESEKVEVHTKAEAIEVAEELAGKFYLREPGKYRVVPGGYKRPRRVSSVVAETLKDQGWNIERRVTTRWAFQIPASAETVNKYRAHLSAAFDFAIRRGWMGPANPVDEVPRRSVKAMHQRALNRNDYYVPEEVSKLLDVAPSLDEEAFWLLGAHAGLRLPGEAQGLTWGMVDLDALLVRPLGNWVQGAPDTPKTSLFAPVPMTPRLARALSTLKERSISAGDDDYVFAGQDGRPMPGERIRESFAVARAQAELKPIRMYNLRHSFGTGLAARGVPIRSIQALMRHSRITTTEKYMAYAPQPELANQIAGALEPASYSDRSDAARPASRPNATLLERLEEEIPAKWLRVVEDIYRDLDEGDALAA